MKKLICLLLSSFLLASPAAAFAEEEIDDSSVYVMKDLDGNYITSRAGRIYTDDEYISSDNQLYIVVQVNDDTRTAVAANMGQEPPVNAAKAREVFAHAEESASGERKLICMYSTHSDESYVPTDGDSSLLQDAGIYDVKVVDTTAAGDSFIGGLCKSLCDGLSMTDAVAYASAVSSITVSRPGAGVSIPTADEVAEFLKNHTC